MISSPHPDIPTFLRALEVYNLEPLDDVTRFFDEGDIIEIYDLEFKQLFRNLTFFKFCSYDSFTLYTKPFYELYSRPEHVNQQILKLFNYGVFNFKKTEKFAVEVHFLKETYQNNRKLFKIHPKWMSPLRDKTTLNIVAMVLTNRCEEHLEQPI
jgi:hypothetical protein